MVKRQEVHRGGQLRRQGQRVPQGRRGGRHRGRSLQGHLRPRHQHPDQAAEHGIHRVRRPDRQLLPSVKSPKAIENSRTPGRRPGVLLFRGAEEKEHSRRYRREGKCEREPSGFPFAFDHPPQRPRSQNKTRFCILRFCPPPRHGAEGASDVAGCPP